VPFIAERLHNLTFDEVFEHKLLQDHIMSELADLSNLIDYIANKMSSDYPTKYGEETKG
jgi:hypothetical protein